MTGHRDNTDTNGGLTYWPIKNSEQIFAMFKRTNNLKKTETFKKAWAHW